MCDREISKRQAFLIWLASVIGMVLIDGWCFLLHWLGVW
jgi:hypothetical protein